MIPFGLENVTLTPSKLYLIDASWTWSGSITTAFEFQGPFLNFFFQKVENHLQVLTLTLTGWPPTSEMEPVVTTT